MWSYLAPSESRNVTQRLILSWYERRASTGFPEIAERKHEGPYRPVRAWDLYDALVWYLNWKPKERPLGAPKGNQNALKHGRYAKKRAAA
jgi:hypothetical protein